MDHNSRGRPHGGGVGDGVGEVLWQEMEKLSRRIKFGQSVVCRDQSRLTVRHF